MRNQLSELPRADYYPFTSNYLQIKGINIHYLAEGSVDDPTILFLHGNPTWSFLYRRLIANLKTDFHCLALDYPGFGLSDQPRDFDYLPVSQAEIVERFIGQLGLDSFSLFVHDWGGPIGLKIAGQKPELINNLVITNTWAWPVQKNRLQLFSWLLGTRLGKKFILNQHGFVNYIMPWGIMNRRRQFKHKFLPFYRISARRPTYVFPREIIESEQFLAEVEANLTRLAAKPTMLLWGRWDPAFGRQEIKKFSQLLRPEKAIKLSAGHYLMEDKPQEISSYLRNFLNSS